MHECMSFQSNLMGVIATVLLIAGIVAAGADKACLSANAPHEGPLHSLMLHGCIDCSMFLCDRASFSWKYYMLPVAS